MTLKLGLNRTDTKNCMSEFCHGLPTHTHTKRLTDNDLLDKLLMPKLSKSILERESQFKKIYSEIYKQSCESTQRSHKYRNQFKLGRPLEVGQKVLEENHHLDLSKSKKLAELRSGPYEIETVISPVTYKIKICESAKTDKYHPKNVMVVHRNKLIEYFPIEKTEEKLIQDYIPKFFFQQDTVEFYENLNESQNENSSVNPGVVIPTEDIPVESIEKELRVNKPIVPIAQKKTETVPQVRHCPNQEQ